MSIAHTDTRQAILDGLALLWEPGGTYELRVLNAGRSKTVSGYFRDPEKFAHAAAHWNGKAPGIYMTINPVEPSLLARASDRALEFARVTTSDTDIVRRRWLPLDFDPVRPAGISATDAQHDAAIERAVAGAKLLISTGVPRDSIVLADSGNGGHLLVRIDLPNSDEATQLVRHITEAISLRLSDDTVKCDLISFNAARIWKVYGSLACKGDDLPEFPHRVARLLKMPETAVIAPHDVLVALAGQAPPTPPARTSIPSGQRFNVDDFITRHLSGTVEGDGPWNGGRKWVLVPCPFNAEHTDRSAVIVEHASGALAFKCHHNSCIGKSWSDVRDLFEPRELHDLAPIHAHETAPANGGSNGNGNGRGTYVPAGPTVNEPTQPAPTDPSDDVTSLLDLLNKEIPPARWAIHGILPEGATLFVGKSKMGKSWAALGLIMAVGYGGRAFGQIKVEPGDVLYLALEDNERRLQDRCRKVLLEQKPPNTVYLALKWPRIDEGGLDKLDGWLTAHPTIRLVVIDTLKKIRPPSDGGNKSVYDRDYESLEGIHELSGKHHCAILVIHHMRKGVAEDPLDTINGSSGLAASADGIWIFERDRSEDDAKLSVFHREAEDQELALTWDPATVTWTLAGDAEEYQITKERKEIVNLLREQGESMTIRDISNALDKNLHTTRTLIRKMVLDAILHAVGTSHYALSGNAQESGKEKNDKNRHYPHYPPDFWWNDAKEPNDGEASGVSLPPSLPVITPDTDMVTNAAGLMTPNDTLMTGGNDTQKRDFSQEHAKKRPPNDPNDDSVCIGGSEGVRSIVPGYVEDDEIEVF